MIRSKLIKNMAKMIIRLIEAMPTGEALMVLSVARQRIKNRKEAKRSA